MRLVPTPHPHASEITAAKQAVRRSVRARRRSGLADADRAKVAERLGALALRVVTEHLEQHQGSTAQSHPVCRVAAYESWVTEPPTEAMIAALAGAGHDVVVPITRPDLTLDWRHPGPGSPALGADAIASAQVIFTPGLGVDRTGLRLGQGGGCYDGALRRRDPGSVVLTVIYDAEFVDGPLPAEPHDQRVDGVLTPGGVVWF